MGICIMTVSAHEFCMPTLGIPLGTVTHRYLHHVLATKVLQVQWVGRMNQTLTVRGKLRDVTDAELTELRTAPCPDVAGFCQRKHVAETSGNLSNLLATQGINFCGRSNDLLRIAIAKATHL